MNYGNLLRQHMNVSYEDISEICVSISTTNDFYPLCFIGYEDDDVIGIYSTQQNLSEKYVIINKEYIISISIVYQDDYDIYNADKENKDNSYYL